MILLMQSSLLAVNHPATSCNSDQLRMHMSHWANQLAHSAAHSHSSVSGMVTSGQLSGCTAACSVYMLYPTT